jgi:sugar phosphate isomerase/epimerase
MIKSGLASISFRNLSTDMIVEIAKDSGLLAIEWGGDVHVPHGDIQKAKQVKDETLNPGLETAAYASYYKAGESEIQGLKFEEVLATAVELAAPTVRVWAGLKSSRDADENYRKMVADDLFRVAKMAEKKNISIGIEYYVHTLTDSTESTLKLLDDVDHNNLFCYWQPPVNDIISHADCKSGLNALVKKVSNIHVYHWSLNNEIYTRYPLKDGFNEWKEYLDIIKLNGGNHYALLEFVLNDSVEQLKEDADTLNELISLSL